MPAAPQGSMLRRRHGFRANFQEEFEKLDANGDGFLTLEELAAGLNHHMGEAELIALFNKLDTNKDGRISLDEYVMGSVNNCREHASRVQDGVTESINNLEHVLDDLRKDKTLDSLSKLITDSIEKRNKAVWKEKKGIYRKMPYDEFKNLLFSKFDARDASRSGGINEDRALVLFQDLGKTFSKPDFRVFLSSNDVNHEEDISREQVLKLMLELLKEKAKFSSSVRRLMVLSQPKKSPAGRSVEDYLQQQVEEIKDAGKKAKLWKKNALKARSFGAKSNKLAAAQPVLRRAASADQANYFQWEFKRLDTNGDGVLTAEELFDGLKHRLGQDELSELFDNIDVNGDGLISQDEYVEARKTMQAFQKLF
ncbi:hypothetical protein GUITHDRAFT_120744 [Guillardia theta CCMP2712]|uniref:EF-hand domain-containing protein n=1 Tax=Guillardia theta (strain CCMP2712) TaxID=905079 RepID=L1IAZ0_GUITC|nr:hypothetical protein GUITHDRAFT_120744 [Guillardia theta CCMP2712]EKX33084.1 hypothetical protein GUITHDRAFT_120744 [Guillardia theta CCMP2712]|eukprot:XP_005820064.1 hypothetical protein GUITHDRAFT_120744 [Guillardia theta CCMP2712]